MNKFIRMVSAIMLFALIPIAVHAQKVVKILSPDKKITVDLTTEKGKFGWTVNRDGAKVYSMEDVRMIINGNRYDIMLIDNPMEMGSGSQLEFYLRFTGGQ